MATKTVRSPAERQKPVSPAGVRLGTGTAAGIYTLLSLFYFLPAFLPGQHIFGTDYLAGGYFFYDFVSQRLSAGEIPKWVPYLYGGLPLYANPGSTFYPVRLFADFLLPVTWILPFIFLFQFAAAGLGMYLLARELGSRPWVALVAGLAFQFTGITISAVYAGHDGRVIVATFAPLFFYFLHRGIRTGALSAFVGVAATLGFALLSFQIQSNYYLLLAGAIWAVFCLVHLRIVREPGVLARRVAFGLVAIAFGFSLAAVNFLPFLDYVPESPRGGEEGRGYEYSVSWSMPPGEILAVAVPEHAGILENYEGANPFKLHTEYLGALVLLLLVLGFRFSRGDRYWWFFLGLAVFTLTIAFGGHTPLYRLYYEVLPGTKRFRAPSISFFVFSFSLVTMAAITLERMASARGARDREPARRKGAAEPRESINAWLGGIVGVAVLGVLFASASAGAAPRDAAMVAGFGRFALFTTLVAGAVWLWWNERLRTLAFAAAIGLITVADLWVVNRNFFETVPPPAVTFAPDDVVLFLSAQPQPARTWVLPFPTAYRGHGNYLMLFGLEQAGGEHGNQLQRFNEFAGAGQDVYVDWSNFLEDANFLHAANIRYIVSMAEIETPFLREVHRGSALVYENVQALPRAYLAAEVRTVGEPGAALAALREPGFDVSRTAVVQADADPGLPTGPLQGTAEVVSHEPDRVVIRTTADRRALLVLSDNYLHGWTARVNGVDSPILVTNHAFRGVVVDEGESEVVFEYRPAELYTGFYIYLFGMALLLVFALVTVARSVGRGGGEGGVSG
jgi:hypothetical protein